MTRALPIRRLSWLAANVALALALVAPPAGATTTVTANVASGSFGFCSVPATASFPAVALNGQNATSSMSTNLGVCDARGSGAGWNVQATSTQFAPSPSYDALLSSLSPTAWWKLNDPVGSTSAVDSSGNGSTATVNGGVTFVESSPRLKPGDSWLRQPEPEAPALVLRPRHQQGRNRP